MQVVYEKKKVVEMERGEPYFHYHYGPEEYVCGAPWWPSFPLHPGRTERFDDGKKSQHVREEGDGLIAIVTAEGEHSKDLSSGREVVMLWEQGRPWWSTLKTRQMYYDFYGIPEPPTEEQWFQVEGQVIDWRAPRFVDDDD